MTTEKTERVYTNVAILKETKTAILELQLALSKREGQRVAIYEVVDEAIRTLAKKRRVVTS